MDQIIPPDNSALDGIVVQGEQSRKSRQVEMGLLGRIFGSRDHAPINIAGTVIVLGVIGLFFIPYLPPSQGLALGDMLKLVGSVVLAALTFLGGYLGGSGKP